MDYSALKHSHVGLAYLSILLFIIRFALFKFKPTLKSNKLLKILPHIIDTFLLIFAIWLCTIISQYPLTDHWLTAKVIGLVGYIAFGVIAIKQGKNWAFVAALVSFAYIFSAAKTHSALSFFSHFS
ncbi:MAG: regulator SirB [Oleispira sp.]|jgi:uncharacterized membrane protein SirB2|nr:regulator SirB [Oleispira sp.]|tara:strand:- start:6129 stop:6506 length:378 start_codon:yes stop_codon:yes gene_type:complete